RAGHDENRVLARDGSEDVGVDGLVDRLAQRARETGRGEDEDEVLVALDAERPAAERELEVAQAVGIGRAGRRVDESAAARADLDEAELLDVARHGRLDDLVPQLAKRLRELGLRRDRPLADQAQDDPLPLATVHRHRTPSRIASASSTSSAVTT